MRKQLLMLLVTTLACMVATAVPVKPGLTKTVTQSDGTDLSLRMVGDEWHHSWVTTDGKPVIQAANGDMVYRTAAGASTVIAHAEGSRSFTEESFLNLNASQMTAEAIMAVSPRVQAGRENMARNLAHRVPGNMPNGPRRGAGNPQVPQIGSPKVPIILVQFSDIKFKNSYSAFVTRYTSPTQKSAYKYFYS